jgi:glycosyltransferase involved in cell wall biosynthesis
MPIGILSAMARSMPIVATDVDGCGEAIINEKTGLLVSPRCPEQLAFAIARLVNNEQEAFELGRNAKKRFSEIFCTAVTFPEIKKELVDS